jgi:septal ring factor EnvC (AmiA/AmiB activator)
MSNSLFIDSTNSSRSLAEAHHHQDETSISSRISNAYVGFRQNSVAALSGDENGTLMKIVKWAVRWAGRIAAVLLPPLGWLVLWDFTREEGRLKQIKLDKSNNNGSRDSKKTKKLKENIQNLATENTSLKTQIDDLKATVQTKDFEITGRRNAYEQLKNDNHKAIKDISEENQKLRAELVALGNNDKDKLIEEHIARADALNIRLDEANIRLNEITVLRQQTELVLENTLKELNTLKQQSGIQDGNPNAALMEQIDNLNKIIQEKEAAAKDSAQLIEETKTPNCDLFAATHFFNKQLQVE